MQIGKTFEISGKTYNTNQINAVFIENTNSNNPYLVAGVWIGGGILTAGLMGSVPDTFDTRITNIIWGGLTIASIVIAIRALISQDFCLVFEMSSGRLTAVQSDDKDVVENLKTEIVNAIEKSDSKETTD